MLIPQPKEKFSPPLAVDDPTAPLVYAIARAADERKAQSVKAIRVTALTTTTSFFVVMCGKTRIQIQAIATNICDEVSAELGLEARPQGDPASGWVVLDFGDAIAHIFTPQTKSFYDLESLWRTGQELSLEGVVSPEALLDAVEDDIEGNVDEEGLTMWDDDADDLWG